MDLSFGDWVRRRRKSLDLTQQELAVKVGCSVSLIFKMEADERRPSRQIAELLAETLEIPAEQRDLFLRIARQQKGTDGLDSIAALTTPAPESPASPPPSRLPRPLTSLIGREHELRMIQQQLQDPACRLLTLTGPGGTGKTRLALEVAVQMQDSFEHGVHFVSLAGTSSLEFIIPAVAETLALSFSGTTELKSQLLQYLKGKRLLLVLDNLEHLLNGIELLDEFLQYGPHLKLLTTSREPLNLGAEWAFEVQGLPVPVDLEWQELESNSAAALFIQRAHQMRTSFTVSPEDTQAIIRICRLVEGLPLGLELAASWVRVMSVNEIAQEIERSLDFLTTAARDVPPRHRSIRAVFDSSWDLLSEAEQHILRQLPVFRGGFTRDAAKQVAGAELSHLSALVDKSLLRRTDLPDGWYDFHELIRQYVDQKAQENPEEHAQLHERHAGYYAAWLQHQESRLHAADQEEALSQIGREMDNLRVAWNWMVAHRHVSYLQQSLASLFVWHDVRNWLYQGLELFERAVAALHGNRGNGDDQATQVLLGELMVCQAHLSWHVGQTHRARELLQQSIQLLGAHRDRPMLAEAFLYLSLLEHSQGNYPTARKLAEDCVSLNQEQERGYGLGYALSNLGMICLTQGEYETAYARLKEGFEVMRSIDHTRGTSTTLSRLGLAALKLDQLDEAQQLLEQSLKTTQRLNDRWGSANTLHYLGLLAHKQGDLERAESLLRDSVKLFEEDGEQILLASTLTDLGFVRSERDADPEAGQIFLRALQVAHLSLGIPAALYALIGMAELLFKREGKKEHAFEVVSFVLRHPAANHETRERAASLRIELDAQLTPDQIEAGQARAQNVLLETLLKEL